MHVFILWFALGREILWVGSVFSDVGCVYLKGQPSSHCVVPIAAFAVYKGTVTIFSTFLHPLYLFGFIGEESK